MKIAVIGAKGFVGSSIARHLKKQYKVTEVTRETLDLLDCIQVKDFLKSNMFDVVIDCAATMTDSNGIHDARNNLGIFMNFYNNSTYFKKFINTGSGAEFDRETNINLAKEDDIFKYLPKDSYGFGQNIKSRLCIDKSNFYTLRIFNCFGNREQSSRLFPNILRAEKEVIIQNDRYFDYFYINDLCNVVDNCIENDWNISDINCVYDHKYKISDVANLFCKFNRQHVIAKVISTSNNNYTGDHQNLYSLNIKLLGLKAGLKNYLKE